MTIPEPRGWRIPPDRGIHGARNGQSPCPRLNDPACRTGPGPPPQTIAGRVADPLVQQQDPNRDRQVGDVEATRILLVFWRNSEKWPMSLLR